VDRAGPRWLYLHGFASGPDSRKGVALAAHYAARGVKLERLDLRRPSLERLRLAEMMRVVREAIGGDLDRAVLFGSSLGGYVACRVAEEDPRVCALVLMAPALRVREQTRAALGEPAWRSWEETGWLTMRDYTTGGSARVDFGFMREAADVDARSGGWPDVRVPTLVVHGRGDLTLDVEVTRAWAAGRRHVRLVEVDDGHDLGASIERIAQEADDFLRPFLG
jgi:pimeloyl-ACP methyl ester carboxylesterase